MTFNFNFNQKQPGATLNDRFLPLVSLIEHDNGKTIKLLAEQGEHLTKWAVTFSVPETVTDKPNFDTKVTMTAIEGQGYTGEQTFYYRRYPLSKLFAGTLVTGAEDETVDFHYGFETPVELEPGTHVTATAIFNKLFSETTASLEDILVEGLPEDTQDTFVVTIKASPNSYTFKGSFKAKFKVKQLPVISEEFPVSDLTGLTELPVEHQEEPVSGETGV